MRLINVETLTLGEFRGNEIPSYAILSHTWGSTEDELSFSDIVAGNTNKAGRFKLEGCCEQAKKDKLEYIWIDTCCIDKNEFTELPEAINSMFRWYKQATRCYAYLSDVSLKTRPLNSESHHEHSFSSSRWFRRGWTLQELLSPRDVFFYDHAWRYIGSREGMSRNIETITRIPQHFLRGWGDFRKTSVAQRMSWAADRETTKEEDIAYCLIGIFDISMDMQYGEGGEKAFIRLQRRIMEETGDPSILAWGFDLAKSTTSDSTAMLSAGVLGAAPSSFARCGRMCLNQQAVNFPTAFDISGGRLRVNIPLHTTPAGEIYGLLNCGPNPEQHEVVGVPLRKTTRGAPADEYLRPQGRCPILLPSTATAGPTRPIHILMERQSEAPKRRYWLYVDGLEETNLQRNEDYPTVSREQGRTLIAEATDSGATISRRYLTRFRTKFNAFLSSKGPPDIVVVLDVMFNSSTTTAGAQLQFQHHVMVLSGSTSLKDLSRSLIYMRPEAFGKKTVRNSGLNVKVAVEQEQMTEDVMLVIKLALTSTMPEMTVDADQELTQAHLKRRFVAALQQEDGVRQEAEQLGQQRFEKNAAADEKKRRLAATKETLRTLKEQQRSLEERQRSLEAELVKEERDLEQVNERQEMVRKQLVGLWGQQSSIQQYLDELETQQGPGNWLEMAIKAQPDAGKSGSGLNDAGDVDPDRLQLSRAARNGHDIDGQTPLSWAASNGHEAVARLLVDKGAAIEGKDKDGKTPLIVAALYGHEAVARLLVGKGANLEARDNRSRMPLMMAAWQGHEAVVRLLVEKGADQEAKSNDGRTPLIIAAYYGHEAVARLLVGNGASLEARDSYGRTPLMMATWQGHEAVVRLLIEEGADHEAKSSVGRTPLNIAARNGYVAVVRLLISKGANLEARDNNRRTPLMMATWKGHEAVARLLIEEGADCEAKSNDGKTPLMAAEEGGHDAVVHLVRRETEGRIGY